MPGASPPEKHATLLSRMQQSVETARLFYTTRPESRSTPSGQRGGNSLLPPFTSQTFAAALRSMGVDTRFTPRGEADGVCVALAAQVGGYVMGRDTDFVILASSADGMKGYIPLDMIEWTEGSPAPASSQESSDNGFMTVAPGRRQRAGKRPQSRLLPPHHLRNSTLVLPTFTAPALARRLRLPLAMLPLLASLVGNDYASADLSNGGKPADRIDRIAGVLRETQARPRAAGGHAETAYDLVARVVRKLHIRPYVDERELAATVDAVVDATIHYVLPPPQCCAVYPFCGELDPAGCRSLRSGDVSRTGTPAPDVEEEGVGQHESARDRSARAYAAAQARGYLNLVTHVWLHPDRVYLWGVLENPTGPSARAACLPTVARRAAYAIVDEALGLRWPALSEEEKEVRRQDREAATLLAGLSVEDKTDMEEAKEADDDEEGQEQEDGSDDDDGAEPAANGALVDAEEEDDTPRRVVVEHLRQGSSTRIAARDLPLPPPSEATTPTALLPLDARLAAYRDALTCPPSIASLPVSLQPLAAALRLCVVSSAESDPEGRLGRRWRRTEVEAVLRAAIGCAEGWEAADDEEEREGEEGEWDDAASMAAVGTTSGGDNYPVLTNRGAELVAQFSAALLDTMALAQALLLLPSADDPSTPKAVHSQLSTGEVSDDEAQAEAEPTPTAPASRLTHLTPYIFISGSALHSLLAGNDPPPSSGWRWSAAWKHKLHRTLDAVLEGAEEMLAVPVSPKRRKAKMKAEKAEGGRGRGQAGPKVAAAGGARGGGGRFDLLLSEDM